MHTWREIEIETEVNVEMRKRETSRPDSSVKRKWRIIVSAFDQ